MIPLQRLYRIADAPPIEEGMHLAEIARIDRSRQLNQVVPQNLRVVRERARVIDAIKNKFQVTSQYFSQSCSSYLEAHIYLLNTFFFSFRPNNASTNKYFSLGKIIFWIVKLAVLFRALQKVKFALYFYDGNSAIERRVLLCYYLNQCVLHFSFARFIICDYEKVKTLLSLLKAWQKNVEPKLNGQTFLKDFKLVFVTALITLIFVLLYRLSQNIALSEWDMEFNLYLTSISLLEFTSLWNLQKNQSVLFDDAIDMVDNLTISKQIALGSLQMTFEIIEFMQQCLINDIFLFAAISMYFLSKSLYNSIIIDADIESSQDCSTIWRRYHMLRKITDCLDNAFGILFIVLHIHNVLQCTYFLFECLLTVELHVKMMFSTYRLLKVVLSYCLCVQGSRMLSQLRVWIHDNWNDIERYRDVKGPRPITVILDDYTFNPVGIGTRSFHVNESFAAKFAGMIVSLFLVFAQS